MNVAVNVKADRKLFDEEAYLRLYPDIAAAIASGNLSSGWIHYLEFGAQEGRRPNDFDAEFYLNAYPEARIAVAQGRAKSAIDHYFRFGRGCGFLPNRTAPRVPHPGGQISPFGGLWIDQQNAASLIEGKLEIGQITSKQAAQLRFFSENGYIVLPQAIGPKILAAAKADLEKAYAGGFPDLRFECGALGNKPLPFKKEHLQQAAKALDLHYFAPSLRELIFSEHITRFLELIFEGKTFASQTLSFLRGSAQEPHQDSAYVVYTLPRQFAASWIALEDVTIGAGELFYYPGSHRFPDFLYGGKYKNVPEARRMGAGEEDLDRQVRRHVLQIEERAQLQGIKKDVFAAKAGDALIWHPELVHGGNPISRKVTRKSVVTHYCPNYAAPIFGEHRGAQVQMAEHKGHFWINTKRF